LTLALIVTKSVSRFARNTVDSLQTIRKLKEHKVEVSFEKEYIQNGGNP
jgi:DNA invertase Pin-like site-specific DNA recombinase